MSQLRAQLRAAQARRQAAEDRITTIHNDTIHLDRQIDEARATLDTLEHEWEVLQEEDTAAQREAADAIEEIRRLTEEISITGGRTRQNHTHRTHRKSKAGNV